MYEKADLRMNVGHFKISSSLTTLSKKTFGDSVKWNQLQTCAGWLSHAHKHLFPQEDYKWLSTSISFNIIGHKIYTYA